MNLALLVYGITTISNISNIILAVIIILAIGIVIWSGYVGIECTSEWSWDSEEKKLDKRRIRGKYWKVLSIVGSVTLALSIIRALIPSEKTMYVMVGAYAAQQIIESPDAKRLYGKTLTIIETKLDEYIEEASKTVDEKTSDKTKK